MKLSLIGTIDETHTIVGGQYDRTEMILDGLRNKGLEVKFVNMIDWKRNIFKILLKIICYYFLCDEVIFISWVNGAKVNLMILKWLEKISKRPAFYIAIGGKQNIDFINREIKYRDLANRLSCVFVETEPMVNEFRKAGIDNVFYLPNCKYLNLNAPRVEPSMKGQYKFCTYSRVMPEKGIKEAIDVVERLNQKNGKPFCTLDIYGTYYEKDKMWFESLLKKTSNAISYKGRIERKDSILILGQYDLMLFPTKHANEGVPGSMIDCYEAGLPIIVSNTSFMPTLVINGETGFVYNVENEKNLDEAIFRYINLSFDEKRAMRSNCLKYARKFDTSVVIETLFKHLILLSK